MDKIIEDWRANHTDRHKEIMYESGKLGRKIATGCLILSQGTSTTFLLMQLSMQRQNRELPYSSYFPFDVKTSPSYEIVWMMQGLSALGATLVYSGVDGIFAVLVMHLCGQLTILADDLNELVKQGNISYVVKRHNELNMFVHIINFYIFVAYV